MNPEVAALIPGCTSKFWGCWGWHSLTSHKIKAFEQFALSSWPCCYAFQMITICSNAEMHRESPGTVQISRIQNGANL